MKKLIILITLIFAIQFQGFSQVDQAIGMLKQVGAGIKNASRSARFYQAVANLACLQTQFKNTSNQYKSKFGMSCYMMVQYANIVLLNQEVLEKTISFASGTGESDAIAEAIFQNLEKLVFQYMQLNGFMTSQMIMHDANVQKISYITRYSRMY
jgi:hypothetical protein